MVLDPSPPTLQVCDVPQSFDARWVEMWLKTRHTHTHTSHSYVYCCSFIHACDLFRWCKVSRNDSLQMTRKESFRVKWVEMSHSNDRLKTSHPNKDSVDMGWLRLVGSLKTYVSFAKEPSKRDYILQKRLLFWRSQLIIATPYQWLKRITQLSVTLATKCNDVHMSLSWYKVKYSLLYRALLQKRHIFWRSLLIVATPCQTSLSFEWLVVVHLSFSW